MKKYKDFLKEGIFPNWKKDLNKRIKDIGLGMWQWGFDNNEKNIGKFVIVNSNERYTRSGSSGTVGIVDNEIYNFLQKNIGEITMAWASKSGCGISYMVKYDNIPNNLQTWFTQNPSDMTPRYLVCMDQNIEFIGTYDECDFYIEAKKYNL
jgi:hypothetical protein